MEINTIISQIRIIPDVFIKFTIEEIKEGKSEILLKAIEIINN